MSNKTKENKMSVAKALWSKLFGFTYLLGSSAKIEKSNKSGSGFYSEIMYLSPHKRSGWNVCPWASAGCIAVCLNTSGHGRFDDTQKCRINRTKLFFTDRATFLDCLIREIKRVERKALKLGMVPAVRLNGTSDIKWEKVAPQLFELFPNVVFYDYTKSVDRMFADLPANYTLTFSRSENNDADCERVLKAGKKVAMVFSGDTLPETYKGYPVLDGDLTDERFLEQGAQIVGLLPKGDAKKDDSGFVIQQ